MPHVQTTTPRRRRPRRPRRGGIAQSLTFTLLEPLLTARSASWFPTNGAGPDEDVNVYLAGKLVDFVDGGADTRRAPGAWPLLTPPGRQLSRAERADRYRANADDRLLHLGLFGRGDGCRRRATPCTLRDGAVRQRDLEVMRTCYAAAAAMLAAIPSAPRGLVDVMNKLAAHGDDYVHVLQVLAQRHLGWGARLTSTELDDLYGGNEDRRPDAERPAMTRDAVDSLIRPRREGPTMDVVLDLMLAHRRRPTADLERRLANLAIALELDPAALQGAAAAG